MCRVMSTVDESLFKKIGLPVRSNLHWFAEREKWKKVTSNNKKAN